VRKVSIIGVGQTRFGNLKDMTLKDMIAEAGNEAVKDAGVPKQEIQELFVGNFAAANFNNQNHIAPYAGSVLGLAGIPCTHYEGACASGGLALRQAIITVASGARDVVMVLGVEKMNSLDTGGVTTVLSQAGDWEEEAMLGLTFPSVFSLIACRHMHEFGTTREHLAQVAVKNHANGMKNPKAHMQKLITIETALNSKRVAEPLGLYDCSLISDGAAALILCAADVADRYPGKPVDVIGYGQASDIFTIYRKDNLTSIGAAVRAGQEAYSMAGITPADVDLAEVHDCFTIAEIVAIEDLGFVAKGEGGPATAAGFTAMDGEKPVNTSGGLKSKGHPVGATGVAQVIEIVNQLRGTAGERQVKGAEIGLTHNVGGSGATCVVHIMKRRA
jgi:acetyl-CoA C-acetyltransferase